MFRMNGMPRAQGCAGAARSDVLTRRADPQARLSLNAVVKVELYRVRSHIQLFDFFAL